MVDRLDSARVLIYSHDTFGLGHLRRCRTIAHALVENFKSLSVLILSGSPIIGSFDFKSRVDFVRIPGVIKLRNGDYTSLGLHIDLEQTLRIRESIISHTADVFEPDLFLVDKEPLGLRGEVQNTLEAMNNAGVFTVLGLRDILDEPAKLDREWTRKNVMPSVQDLYDQIWVYGDECMGNPLEGIDLPESVVAKLQHTGYLRRGIPEVPATPAALPFKESYLLVTAGGGGDGEGLINSVITTCEAGHEFAWPILIVMGPFMPAQRRDEFLHRVEPLTDVEIITFDSNLEVLMEKAEAVVAMGGYNTFCEILSLDKRALIVPRSRPRQEQLIRARRAADIGLLNYIHEDDAQDPQLMAERIRAIENQPLPSTVMGKGFMSGLDSIVEMTRSALGTDRRSNRLEDDLQDAHGSDRAQRPDLPATS